MIEPAVRQALAQSSNPSAIDLACSEGWFAHRLRDWGARRVVGLDIREQNVRRARLLRDHFAIASDQLELRQADVLSLPLESEEKFSVVLLLGLVYHLEDPAGRDPARPRADRGLCVIESQLTRQATPIEHGWGSTESAEQAQGSFATRVELDDAENPIASSGGVLSLIPNRVALEQMAQVAGFSRVELVAPGSNHNPQYVRGDRAVILAWP